jgi:hypothetical protein
MGDELERGAREMGRWRSRRGAPLIRGPHTKF